MRFTVRILAFVGQGQLAPRTSLPEVRHWLSWQICIHLPSDSSLGLVNLYSRLGSCLSFLRTPLASTTYSLLTGLWLDFHQQVWYPCQAHLTCELRSPKHVMRKAFGFRTFEALEIALYHQLGALPEPQLAHRFSMTAKCGWIFPISQ